MEHCTSFPKPISTLPTIKFLTPSPYLRLPLHRSPAFRSFVGGLHSRVSYINSLLPKASYEETPSFFGENRDSLATLEEVPAAEENVYDAKPASKEPKEEESSVPNAYVEKPPFEESSTDEGKQTFEFLEQFNIKLDTEDAYSIILYGSGALVALWLTSAVVGAIDAIPVFPKLLEVVGLGYTFWFSSRYLLFKKNREELAAKIEELKQQVLGSDDA